MARQREWPVVVGVDGSDPALDAARWGAGEAARTGASLRLVAAVGRSTLAMGGRPGLGHEQRREAALRSLRDHLDAAAQEAARMLPADRIDREIRGGSAAEVLCEESARAATVVLGTRGRGGFAGLLAGSVAVAVTAASRCPVVVVRGTVTADGPVVVGVDRSPGSDAALGLAYEHAAARSAPLVAVHAWSDDVFDPDVALLLDWAAIEADERAVLDDQLAGWSQKYPDVPVRRMVVRGQAAAALLHHSSDAQLLVVGSRGRGGLAGLLLGSVSQAMLQHAWCPVLVARDPGAVEP
ncbi:MAG: universal stress protein [Pseudonocardia sp.]|nr:universal stress protein [Pseudonocardia sp.]